MIESAKGVVLRTRPLSETSLIVHWLTTGHGRIATVAKGARRPKSPFQGRLDLFYLADFTFSRSRTSELHTLREITVQKTHSALRLDLACLRRACYASALIEQTTEIESPIPEIFDLFMAFLDTVETRVPGPQAILAFEFKMLDELGLKPDFVASRLTPGARRIAQSLTAEDWTAISRLRLSAPQRRELGQFLHGFLIYHLEKIPANRQAALRETDK